MRKLLYSFFLIFVGFMASAQLDKPQVEHRPLSKTTTLITVVPKGTGTQSVKVQVTGPGGYSKTEQRNTTALTSFEFHGLQPGATYSYTATASACLLAATTCPTPVQVRTSTFEAPEALPAAAIISQDVDNCPQFVGINWKYSPVGAPIYSVIIQKSHDGNVWHNVAHLPSSETSYYDSGVTPGVHHTYKIITTNSIGDEVESNYVTVLVKPYVGPNTALNFRSDNGHKTDNTIRVTWDNPEEDYACGTNIRASWYIMMKRAWETEYKIVGVTWPHDYYYDITGLEQNETVELGIWPISNKDLFGHWAYLTDKTFGVSSKPENIIGVSFKDAISTSGIDVKWTHNGTDSDYYIVEVSTDGTNFSQLGVAKNGVTNIKHVNLAEGVAYTYRVKAGNYLYGESDWAYMNGYVTYDYSAIPNAPYGLQAKWSGANVDLTWVDDSNKEEKYVIERAPKADGIFQEIGTVGRNINKYTDATMTGDTAYYRVKAENPLGVSAASKVARIVKAATTPATGTVGILAYPNPTVDRLNISVPGDLQGDGVAIKVYNSLNSLVYTKNYSRASEINIDFKRFTPGIYNVVVETGGVQETKKIVKN
jgi:hypothetical protein